MEGFSHTRRADPTGLDALQFIFTAERVRKTVDVRENPSLALDHQP